MAKVVAKRRYNRIVYFLRAGRRLYPLWEQVAQWRRSRRRSIGFLVATGRLHSIVLAPLPEEICEEGSEEESSWCSDVQDAIANCE